MHVKTDQESRATSPVSEGHYYRKQIGCRDGIISWSHRSRFDMAAKLVGKNPGTLLDYGCGDGTFLSLIADRLERGVGADIVPGQVEDCRVRFAATNLEFYEVRSLTGPSFGGNFDVITCMETLEHCTGPTVDVVLNDLARLVKADGRVIISVPIEIGPTFLLKSALRRVAAWRGLSEYRHYEHYPIRDALRMLFAGGDTEVERPVYGEPESPSHSHYGFNWRRLRRRVGETFSIRQSRFSPLGVFRGWVSSQAWFVCSPIGPTVPDHEAPTQAR